MTKFIDRSSTNSGERQKKTKFTHYFGANNEIRKAEVLPKEYDLVVYLGKNHIGNDVFAAYDLDSPVTIYIGEKGDEFN